MTDVLGKLKRSAGLLFGLVLFVGIICFLGDANSFSVIERIKVRHLVVITVITLLINGVGAFRWKLLLSELGIANLPWRVLFENITLAKLTGHTFSDVFGDIAVRIHGLHHQKVSVGGVLFSVLAEKTFEALLLLSILSGWLYLTATDVDIASGCYSGLLIIVAVLTLFSQLPFRFAFWWVKRKNVDQKGYEAISPGFLPGLQAAGLSLVRYLLVTARYATVFRMLGITIDPLEVFYGTSFAHLGLVCSITPGGIGLVEAGWTGYLVYLSVTTGAIGQFLLVQRVVITICIALSAAIVFALRKIQIVS